MEVGVKTIVEESVWFPDLLQHLHIQAELVDIYVVGGHLQPLKREPGVAPVLAEVTVHGVVLENGTLFFQILCSTSALTMSTSDIGPMLRIRILTFTLVGPEKILNLKYSYIFSYLTLAWRPLCLIISHKELLQYPCHILAKGLGEGQHPLLLLLHPHLPPLPPQASPHRQGSHSLRVEIEMFHLLVIPL